jgi:spore maturation protein CgeB
VYASSRVNLGISGIGYSIREMCVKGRDFEVPMCGDVYVTGDQPDLSRVYEKGKEVFAYRDVDDCAKIIHRLLSNPGECEQARAAARARCVAEHTWERRFREAFDVLGVLSSGSASVND